MKNLSSTQLTDREECIQKFSELVSGIKVTMMTTLDSEGGFHSRPMWTQKHEEGFAGDLWFFAGVNSSKAVEIHRDRHVVLSYADPEKNRYLAVKGTAQVVQDRAQAEKLWSPLYVAWFPKGLEDPELSLIRIQVEHAEYWDSPSSKMVQLVGFVKAIATGKPYEASPKEHGKLDLTG